MERIEDPEIWVTLKITLQRDIRELRRLIRAAEKDGEDPKFLKEELARARKAHDFVTAA
ncbi:hypothetical protein AB0C87_24810 [Actinomadura sp. NPDC048021]|uniref:hypothetical protein n=1 Tax=Actinomadura sp. NPDC048021 TaxID=3155385 RepID=UPI0033C1D39D